MLENWSLCSRKLVLANKGPVSLNQAWFSGPWTRWSGDDFVRDGLSCLEFFSGQNDTHINIWSVLIQSVCYQLHFVTVRPVAHDSVVECWRNKTLVTYSPESTHAIHQRELSEKDFSERCRRSFEWSFEIWSRINRWDRPGITTIVNKLC